MIVITSYEGMTQEQKLCSDIIRSILGIKGPTYKTHLVDACTHTNYVWDMKTPPRDTGLDPRDRNKILNAIYAHRNTTAKAVMDWLAFNLQVKIEEGPKPGTIMYLLY